MDDLNLDEIEKDINSKNEVKERIQNVLTREKEAQAKAAEAQKAADEAKARLETLEKENKFFSSFAETMAKYPTAVEYKDKIKEKFNSGYSLDDATISVLHSEGKLSPQAERKIDAPSFGGSAPTQIVDGGKSPKDMSQAERLAGLMDAEKRGDLFLS